MPSAVYLHDGQHQITVTFRTEEDRERFKAHYRVLDALAVAWAEIAKMREARIAALEAAIADVVDAWLGGIDAELEPPMRALIAIIQPQVDAAERNAAANAVISRPTPSGAAMGASRGDSVSVHTSGAYRANEEEAP